MQLFFYGTLMDPDVSEVVIGYRLAADQAEPAVIKGFRRVVVAGRSYPMLLSHAAGTVEGVLVHRLEAAAVHRLMVFEGMEYHLQPLPVHAGDGVRRAGVFLGDHRVRPGIQEWSLATWQRRSKRTFIRRAAYLMERYGTQAMLRRAAGGMPVLVATHEPKRLWGRPYGVARFIAG